MNSSGTPNYTTIIPKVRCIYFFNSSLGIYSEQAPEAIHQLQCHLADIRGQVTIQKLETSKFDRLYQQKVELGRV